MERLLRLQLGDFAQITSAGTHAVVGAGIHRPIAELLERVGADTGHYSATQLTQDLVRSADLILTASVSHRAKVVGLDPKAVSKTFTLVEVGIALSTMDLSTLSTQSVAERISTIIDYVQISRPKLHLPAKKLDIVDPYGLSVSVYEEAFAIISQCVDILSHALSVRLEKISS
jgi:protein-tyrosine phosphatase